MYIIPAEIFRQGRHVTVRAAISSGIPLVLPSRRHGSRLNAAAPGNIPVV